MPTRTITSFNHFTFVMSIPIRFVEDGRTTTDLPIVQRTALRAWAAKPRVDYHTTKIAPAGTEVEDGKSIDFHGRHMCPIKGHPDEYITASRWPNAPDITTDNIPTIHLSIWHLMCGMVGAACLLYYTPVVAVTGSVVLFTTHTTARVIAWYLGIHPYFIAKFRLTAGLKPQVDTNAIPTTDTTSATDTTPNN